MNPYFIVGSVIAVVLAYGAGHWQGADAGQAKVQAKWDKDRVRLAEEYAANVATMRQQEQVMQGNAERLQREKDFEIKKIANTNRILLDSLRQRPERSESSSVSGSTASCSGASGSELARGDAEFLAGYAADAARLQASLNQCLEQYEAIRR